MYTFIKNYRDNDALRASFNRLAQATFGLTFEDWYQNGHWREHYIPYSMVKDGEVVANVSVNHMEMLVDGEQKLFLQLGTVMTAKDHRNQGLIRKIMEEIEKDYAGKVDGMHLFANDSVLDFYPKFGFRKAREYQYSKVLNKTNGSAENRASEKELIMQKADGECGIPTMQPVVMNTKDAWDTLENAIRKNTFHSRLDMVNYSELYMFYVTQFMQENVYYDKSMDAYAIAEIEEGELLLHAVFTSRKIDLDDVIKAFGNDIDKVILGFAPTDTTGYDCAELQEDDTTLFVKGEGTVGFDERKFMFPTLSHA